ncbi:MAG: hypothetical protein COB02_12900 [Candidatus Cloacimonadota bacterium]|nr:MAG: hypothetical protein COB02_12900 [Candidatus Cloacimonadota bacterium]
MKLQAQGKIESSTISYTISVLEYTTKNINELLVDYHDLQMNEMSQAHIYDSYKEKSLDTPLVSKLRQKVFSKLNALNKLQSSYNDLIKNNHSKISDDSFNDSFFSELKLQFSKQKDFLIASSMIESIDEQGYLIQSNQILATNFDVSISKIKTIRQQIQQLNPIGLTTRDFDEYVLIFVQQNKSLILQKFGPTYFNFYQNFFKKYSRAYRISPNETLKSLNVSSDECQLMLQSLQKLGLKLNPITEHKIKSKNKLPELKVILNDGSLTISSINDLHNYAKLKDADIDFYSQAIEGIDDKSKLQLISKQLIRSKTWLYAVYIRMDNMFRISKAILSKQAKWFLNGDSHLEVLKYQDIADKTGISKSVICRCVNEKYILYNNKIIELKFFFSTGIKDKKGRLHSRIKIKDFIKKQIRLENKKSPINDVQLAQKLLETFNIPLSIRVLAKYRNELKILDYSKRKYV